MLSEETQKSLRQFLKSSGQTLKNLSASDVLEVATDFWLATNVEGVRPENGDGLVAYFELMNRGRGILYEFGVNRIMTPASEGQDYSAWLPAFKLRLSVGFKTTLEVFQLRPAILSFACWDKQAAAGFVNEVRASSPFQLITSYIQHSSGISLVECGSPWGNPAHPTQGLSWAIA